MACVRESTWYGQTSILAVPLLKVSSTRNFKSNLFLFITVAMQRDADIGPIMSGVVVDNSGTISAKYFCTLILPVWIGRC